MRNRNERPCVKKEDPGSPESAIGEKISSILSPNSNSNWGQEKSFDDTCDFIGSDNLATASP